MINFDSDKLVIVCFPAGAGGKFLINSLGLSNRCLFQNAKLAEQQIDGNFTPIDKLKYLIDKLNSMKESWNDLDLHSPYLFDVNASDHVDKTRETINYNHIIEKITNLNQQYFFMVSHEMEWTIACLNIWPNARVILFENYEDFISDRNFKIDHLIDDMKVTWNQIRGSDWPIIAPMSIEEFQNIPQDIQNEASTLFHYDKFFKHPSYILEKFVKFKNESMEFKKIYPNVFVYDTDSYKSIDDTVKKINELYTKLELDDFNADSIREYYQNWIAKLTVPVAILEQRYNKKA
jgi:hypothetical protein